MRKPDEIVLFAVLRVAHPRGSVGRRGFLELCARLRMHEKRCFYLLMKWSGRGWWDYGTWAWGGWFTDEAPLIIGEHVAY